MEIGVNGILNEINQDSQSLKLKAAIGYVTGIDFKNTTVNENNMAYIAQTINELRKLQALYKFNREDSNAETPVQKIS